MAMDDTLKTWFVDDKTFLPEIFFGLRKPDGGFFLAVEGQSTDDGKVFINALQDQDTTLRTVTLVRQHELDNLLSQIKVHLKGKKFKESASFDESEHGVAYWSVDEDMAIAAVFSTQGSDLLSDHAAGWLGEAQCLSAPVFEGYGQIPAGSCAEIDSQRALSASSLAEKVNAKKSEQKTSGQKASRSV